MTRVWLLCFLLVQMFPTHSFGGGPRRVHSMITTMNRLCRNQVSLRMETLPTNRLVVDRYVLSRLVRRFYAVYLLPA